MSVNGPSYIYQLQPTSALLAPWRC